MPILKKSRMPLLLGVVFLLALLAAVPLVAAPLRPDIVTISGTVYFDKNGNGARDANEGGIEGVTVQLRDTTTNGGVFNASIVTGVDGAFAFTGVPVDSYTVSHAALPAYTPMTPASVDLGMVETSRTVDFGDTMLLYVTGIEYEDLNHDGVRAPLEPGIQGMIVKIYDDANTNGRVDLGETLLGATTSNEHGHYVIGDLTPGHRVMYTQTAEVGGLQGPNIPLSLQGAEVGAAEVMLMNGVRQGAAPTAAPQAAAAEGWRMRYWSASGPAHPPRRSRRSLRPTAPR